MNRIALMLLKNIHHLPGGLGKLWRYAGHTEDYPELEKWNHIQYLMKLAIKAGNVDLQVTGLENIPEQDGFLMYANHQGMFDVVAMAATFRGPLACVFKKELTNVPMLKQILICTKSFGMDRADVRQSLAVIQAVTQEVLKGRNYLIFPEGTRSRQGNTMVDFHSGSFRAALKAKCPVLPVAYIDSFKVLDEKGSAPVTVQMHFLPPIPYEEFKDMKTGELAQLVKGRIQAAIDAHTAP